MMNEVELCVGCIVSAPEDFLGQVPFRVSSEFQNLRGRCSLDALSLLFFSDVEGLVSVHLFFHCIC